MSNHAGVNVFEKFWSKAVLIKVHCHRPSGFKSVKNPKQVDDPSIRGEVKLVRKLFLKLDDGSDPWNEIINAESYARRVIQKYGVAGFSDMLGVVVVPSEILPDVMEEFETAKEKYDLAVANFMERYEDLKRKAQQVYGSLYSDEDYPPKDQIKLEVGLDVFKLSIPEALERLDQKSIDHINRSAVQRVQETADKIREHFLNVYMHTLTALQNKFNEGEMRALVLGKHLGVLSRAIKLGKVYANMTEDDELRRIIGNIEGMMVGNRLAEPQKIAENIVEIERTMSRRIERM